MRTRNQGASEEAGTGYPRRCSQSRWRGKSWSLLWCGRVGVKDPYESGMDIVNGMETFVGIQVLERWMFLQRISKSCAVSYDVVPTSLHIVRATSTSASGVLPIQPEPSDVFRPYSRTFQPSVTFPLLLPVCRVSPITASVSETRERE